MRPKNIRLRVAVKRLADGFLGIFDSFGEVVEDGEVVIDDGIEEGVDKQPDAAMSQFKSLLPPTLRDLRDGRHIF